MGTYRVPDDDTESEASTTPTRTESGIPSRSPKSKSPPSVFPPYSGVPDPPLAPRHPEQFWRLRPISGPFGEQNIFHQLRAQAEIDRIAANNPALRRSLSHPVFKTVGAAQYPNTLSTAKASKQVRASICGSAAQFTSPSREGTANEQAVGSTSSFIDSRTPAVGLPNTTRTDCDAGLGAGPPSRRTQSPASNPETYTPQNSQKEQQGRDVSSHKASYVAAPKRLTKSKFLEISPRASDAHMSPPETFMQPRNHVSPAIGALSLNPGKKRKASTTEFDLRAESSMMESPEATLCKAPATSQPQAKTSLVTTTSIAFAAVWRFFSFPLAFVQRQVERAFTRGKCR